MANIQSIITNGNNNVLIGTTTDNGFRLNVSGTQYVSGNVSIGTTYNGFALNVAGTTYVIGASVWVQNGYGYVNSGATSTGLFPKSDNTIEFRNNNATNVFINSSGLLSVGTTNPYTGMSTKLYVGYPQDSTVNNADQFISVGAGGGSTNKAGMNFLIYSAGYGARIYTEDITPIGLGFDVLQVGTFYNAMNITRTTSPNVLIGTTTDAGYKLDVNGTFRSQGTAYFSGNVNFSNQYRTYGLPYFEMGGGGVSDEYLLLVPKYVSGTVDPYLLMGELQFQRGSTGTGNDNSITTINIQTAYNQTNFYQFSINGATVWTSIDIISISGVEWYALKARPSGGGPYLVNQFVGNFTDSGSQMLTRVRLSDAGVSLVTANVFLPSYTNYGGYVIQGTSFDSPNFSLKGDQYTLVQIADRTSGGTDVGFISIFSEGTKVIDIPGNSDNVYFNNGGNLGVGNNSPTERLSVSGNVSVVASTGSKIGFNTTDAFSGYGTSLAHYGISYGWNSDPIALSGYYGIGLFTAGSEKARVLGNGNFLIGTTTDNGRKLNVNGDIFASGEFYSNQYAAGRYIRYNWNTTNFTVGAGTATRWVIGRIYWNQVHWGSYSGMDIEIVWNYYNGARKKYTISNGAGGGAIYFRESQSYGSAYGRVSLGSAVDTGTTSGGYSNYYQDVYLEVNEYNYVSVNGELKGPTISIDKTSISGGEYGWATFFSSPSASTITMFNSTQATILTSEGNWGYIDNKLGINVANPSYELDVYAASTPVIRLSSNNSSGVGNPIFIMARGGEETFKLAVQPNVGAIFRTVVANAGYMDFFTGTDSLTLRMSANKNLLIGTTTDPGYRLYVSGGSLGVNIGSATYNQAAAQFVDSARGLTYMPTVGGGSYNWASVTNGSALFNTQNSDWWVGNHDGSALRFVQNSSLVFYTNSGIQGAWTGTGLGIAASNPTTRIDAYGNPNATNGVIQATPTYGGGSYFTAFRARPSDTGDQGDYTGLYMGSISSDNALITSGSVYNSAGLYLPGGTTSTGIGMSGGTFTVFGNTGLTAGTQYYPTARMQVIGSTGNVIIGNTTDAGYKLDVYGEILGRDDIRILNTYALVLNGTDNNWRIGRNTITDSGWLTLNTLQIVVFGGESGQGFQVVNHSGTALFEINGAGGASRFTNSVGVGVNPSGTTGRIDASNDIVAYSTSDQRLKENITPIANALDKVKALTGVEFDWKEDTKAVHGYEGHDVGVIAQEVQAVLPEAVRTNDSGYLSVRYEKMIALLVEANKELASRIEELEKKLK